MSTIVESLTRDIVNRDLSAEGAALLNKWEKTGLLEGLDNERTRNSMAVLLENQAKELLREASSMSAGDVEGFAAVAFPIVRRVFGGLIANELVSVQPMSLPSGLIFFLDFTYTNPKLLGQTASDAFNDGQSVYGGGVVGRGVAQGVNLTGANAELGPYALNNGYASATGSKTMTQSSSLGVANEYTLSAVYTLATMTDALKSDVLNDDPDEIGSTDSPQYRQLTFQTADITNLNVDNLITINLKSLTGTNDPLVLDTRVVRRLTKNVGSSTVVTVRCPGADPGAGATGKTITMEYSRTDISAASGFAIGALELDLFAEGSGDGTSFTNTDLGGQNTAIAEIDIKVDSIAVTANTKKLKAKWSPELAQDLNAYHNLDAEVELTSILSEQVALEIDQEILNDLIKGATAGRLYWSRRPGKFVNRETGAQVGGTTSAPDFTGTVSEWYETLAETINDVSARIHRKTLRGGANFVVCSPEVANLLEFTAGFRASVNHEELKGGSIGAVKVGSMSKKFDVYVDPYFPRQVVLVGRRGGSFLESGYVYAPYVPLQVTPTIFGIEDFVPRKGVMTRYAKKMVRPDMYGIVICQDIIG
tara:strand:- start:5023 stop:6795 length:1773 start_codon:yes stop_codon:yes gene_type:complete